MYGGPPVVVVGCGPVGQTTALLLARWGVPALVLEAAPGRLPTGSRSICQQRDVLDVWDSVGVGRRIAEEGVTWRVARTFLRFNTGGPHRVPIIPEDMLVTVGTGLASCRT